MGGSGQVAGDHVAEHVDDLLGGASGRLGGTVDLLQGMVEVGIVEGDDRLAEGGGVAGVECRVPLTVFVAEADDDDVGGADQRLRPDRVDAGPLVIAPERLGLVAQRPGPRVVGCGVVGDRRREGDGKAGLPGPGLDPLAPVGVDLPGEVDLPDPLDRRRAQGPTSSKCLLSIVTWPW
jgi:hypothetical protein